jgi:hypothetical protein
MVYPERRHDCRVRVRRNSENKGVQRVNKERQKADWLEPAGAWAENKTELRFLIISLESE